MDPQQRLLLEIGYTAVHTAGCRNSRAAAQRRIAVAVGMQNIDYEYMSITGTIPSSTYGATGAFSCRSFPCPGPYNGLFLPLISQARVWLSLLGAYHIHWASMGHAKLSAQRAQLH